MGIVLAVFGDEINEKKTVREVFGVCVPPNIYS